MTLQSLTHTHSNEDIFHGSDKMPKHVEMVRTKCQPKIGTDKMLTTEKSPDKMPTFVWLAFCPTTPKKHILILFLLNPTKVDSLEMGSFKVALLTLL